MSLGSAIVKALRERVKILPFHAKWIASTFDPAIQISALSCPRGSAKTWIAGQLAALSLRPGSPTWQAGIETLAVSASLEQSRVLLGFVREALADIEADYRWLDSGQRLACDSQGHRHASCGFSPAPASGRWDSANSPPFGPTSPAHGNLAAVLSCGTHCVDRWANCPASDWC